MPEAQELKLKTDTKIFDSEKIISKVSEPKKSKVQSPSPKSKINESNAKMFNANEGGEYLEYLLFGKTHNTIYESAAKFLLTIHDGTIQDFQEKFQKLMQKGEKKNENYSGIRCLESTEESVIL